MSFTNKELLKENDAIMLLTARAEDGAMLWAYVLADADTYDQALQASQEPDTEVNLKDFGGVLASGFGQPPREVIIAPTQLMHATLASDKYGYVLDISEAGRLTDLCTLLEVQITRGKLSVALGLENVEKEDLTDEEKQTRREHFYSKLHEHESLVKQVQAEIEERTGIKPATPRPSDDLIEFNDTMHEERRVSQLQRNPNISISAGNNRFTSAEPVQVTHKDTGEITAVDIDISMATVISYGRNNARQAVYQTMDRRQHPFNGVDRDSLLQLHLAIKEGIIDHAVVEVHGRISNPAYGNLVDGTGRNAVTGASLSGIQLVHTIDLPSGATYSYTIKGVSKDIDVKLGNHAQNYTAEDREVIEAIETVLANPGWHRMRVENLGTSFNPVELAKEMAADIKIEKITGRTMERYPDKPEFLEGTLIQEPEIIQAVPKQKSQLQGKER